MSIECAECERDVRGGHDDECSRASRCTRCDTVVSAKNVSPTWRRQGMTRVCVCGATAAWEDE
jgi:hypothetical protein